MPCISSLILAIQPGQSGGLSKIQFFETGELIQDLNYLKDTLQVNQQATTTGSRKLRAVKDLLRDTREEMERREESVLWIERGGWDGRLKERRAAGECSEILGGFEKVCEGWGERILGQQGQAAVAA